MRIVLVALLLAGCAAEPWHGRDLDDPAWDIVVVPANGLHEVDFGLDAGDELWWDWLVPEQTPLDFNLHYHEGDRVIDVVALQDDEDRHSYVATHMGVHSLMWMNPGPEPITLYKQHPEGATVGGEA